MGRTEPNVADIVHWIGGRFDNGDPSARLGDVFDPARGEVVLASDASHFYANMEQSRPFPIVWSLADMLAGYDRLRSLAASPGHIIPGHDPLVLERYPAPTKELQGIVVRLD